MWITCNGFRAKLTNFEFEFEVRDSKYTITQQIKYPRITIN